MEKTSVNPRVLAQIKSMQKITWKNDHQFLIETDGKVNKEIIRQYCVISVETADEEEIIVNAERLYEGLDGSNIIMKLPPSCPHQKNVTKIEIRIVTKNIKAVTISASAKEM